MEPSDRRKFVGFMAAMALLSLLAIGLAAFVSQGGMRHFRPAAAKSEGKTGVAAYLAEPINKPAFEKAVLGRTTREVAEMLGAPIQVLNWEKRTGWEYPINPKERSGVVLFFRDDHVIEIDWGGN